MRRLTSELQTSALTNFYMRLHTRQDKTRQDKTRQDKTRQDKTRQDKTRQDKTRQDKTRQDKTRQDKTRQDKTRQDKTRQDKTRPGHTEMITRSIHVHTNVSLYSRRLRLFQQSLFLTVELLLGHGWWAGSREWWPGAPVGLWESWITPRGAWHPYSRSYGQSLLLNVVISHNTGDVCQSTATCVNLCHFKNVFLKCKLSTVLISSNVSSIRRHYLMIFLNNRLIVIINYNKEVHLYSAMNLDKSIQRFEYVITYKVYLYIQNMNRLHLFIKLAIINDNI